MKYVVHFKKEPFDVYIGRPGPYGNPFTVGVDGTREEVLKKFRDWIYEDPERLAKVEELRGKVMGCWCHPKICHGDVYAEILYENKLF